MDKSIKLALIILLQRECSYIQEEVNDISRHTTGHKKVTILEDRKKRLKLIKALIFKMREENKGIDDVEVDEEQKDDIDFDGNIEFGMN